MPGVRPYSKLIAGLVAVALGVGVWFAFLVGPPPKQVDSQPPTTDSITAEPLPPDPRMVFSTPFRNVKPDVQYVGDAACAACHADIDKAYHTHPMGRSAEWTRKSTPVERFDAAAHNPHRAGPYELRIDRDGDRTTHKVRTSLGEYAVRADLAIGSGTRGRSYLAVENGAVWQTPISWFTSEGGRWDLSPGFDLGVRALRPVIPGCLSCHVNRVEPVPLTLNHYREPLLASQAAIGCERCHGPASLHVAERLERKPVAIPDTSIVNPRHLSPGLRSGVCEQCHLQGEARVPRVGREVFDYRPGLPFEQFVTVFVRHPDLAEDRHSVGQFEQMEQSLCFKASGGNLGCTSCHDPHAVPTAEAKDAFYRGRCMTCHEKKGCTAPLPERASRKDSCTACHMPAGDSANIVHASVTDHAIHRRPVGAKVPKGIPPGSDPIVAFRTSPYAVASAEADRAFGIALMDVLGAAPPPAQVALAAMAAERLAKGVRIWPDDVRGGLAFCSALGKGRRVEEQLAEAQRLARLAPASDSVLAELTTSATAAGQLDLAETAAANWAKQSPGYVEPLLARTGIRAKRDDWDGVDRDAQAALAIYPLQPTALVYRAAVRHRKGNPSEARADAEAAAALMATPQAKAALLDRYQRLLPPP